MMKYITSFWIFFFICTQGFAQVMPQDYQWQHRVLLVFAPDSNSEVFRDQLALLQVEHTGLEERDLVVFRIFSTKGIAPNGDKNSVNQVESLREKYQIANHQFWVILIGKDGSTKLSRSEPLPNKELFGVIDSMPMRKREMADEDHQ